MTKRERVRYEMFLRVRDFGTANSGLFPESSRAGQVFAELGNAIDRIQSHQVAKPLASMEGRLTRSNARAALSAAMQEIVRTARALEGRAAESANFPVFRGKADTSLLANARLFITQGEAVRDDLVQLGLPVTWLEDLREATRRFEASSTVRNNGRRSVSTVQKALSNEFALAFRAVRQLDAIVPNVLRGDEARLAGWRRDRRVIEGATRVQVTSTTPAADSPVPSTSTTPAATPADPLLKAS